MSATSASLDEQRIDEQALATPFGLTVRERLLKAAGEVIDQLGEEQLTLAQVVRRAGLTTGAVYSNFANREELVVAVYVREFEGLIVRGLDALRSLLESDLRGDAFVAELRKLITRPDNEANRRARWLRLRAVAATQRYESVRERVGELQQAIAADFVEVVAEAQARGDLDPSYEPRAVGLLFQQFGFTMVLSDLSGDMAPDPDHWVDLATNLVLPLFSSRA